MVNNQNLKFKSFVLYIHFKRFFKFSNNTNLTHYCILTKNLLVFFCNQYNTNIYTKPKFKHLIKFLKFLNYDRSKRLI